MTTNKELFAKHSHLSAFIETGTCYGRSVELALELRFPSIISVEADPDRWQFCVEKFLHRWRVTIYYGESVTKLPEMIADLDEPALFWLDAHPSGDGSYGQDFERNPEHEQSNILHRELQIIQRHPVQGHVILIDDLMPSVEACARELFPQARFAVHDTDEGPHKVLEIQT